MLQFKQSEVDAFQHTNKALRWGQAFHQHMKLSKITGPDKDFCDNLRNQTDDEKAKHLVRSRIEPTSKG